MEGQMLADQVENGGGRHTERGGGWWKKWRLVERVEHSGWEWRMVSSGRNGEQWKEWT